MISVPSPLPDASLADLVNPGVPREALASARAWGTWLSGLSGRMTWVDGDMVPETNYMARARPGEVAAGYLKSAATRDGLAVWERVT